MQPLILIVDDDFDYRSTLREGLLRQRYRVSVASNGLEAVEMMESFKFDLVFSDYNMPPGPDGLNTAIKLKQINPKTTIVLMNGGNLSQEVVGQILTEGCLIVSKPCSIHDLQWFISKAGKSD